MRRIAAVLVLLASTATAQEKPDLVALLDGIGIGVDVGIGRDGVDIDTGVDVSPPSVRPPDPPSVTDPDPAQRLLNDIGSDGIRARVRRATEEVRAALLAQCADVFTNSTRYTDAAEIICAIVQSELGRGDQR